MEATNVVTCGIVHEVLTKDNYKTWKVLMKNYLLGESLWGVVESGYVSKYDKNKKDSKDDENKKDSKDDENKKDSKDDENRRMNAKALHIIQLSCGSKIFEQISGCKTAKEAWNYLGARYGSKFIAKADIEQVVVDDNLLLYKALNEYEEKGNLRGTKAYIRDKTDEIFLASASGRTVLHAATIVGHVKIVDELVNIGKEKLVEIQDKQGYTALALAAHYTGNMDIAKCMVEKKGRVVRENLLSIKNECGKIPLLLAADKGHKQMTRYLYNKTPKNVLDRQDTRNLVLLLERCIKAEIFDVALGILESYPELPSESLSYGHRFLALRELAQMPSAFFSGCRFGLPQKTIYNSRLLREIVFVFDQFSKYLNIFGIREIYEQKRTHDQVKQILSCLQSSVAEFNNLQLDNAFVHEAMLQAAKHGNVEFIVAMKKANPDLLWTTVDIRKRNIFSYAVLHRKQNVFQLINSLSDRKDILKYQEDMFGNNMLHLAAHLGPSSDLNDRVGAALQMQRELQWFKAVEEVVDPNCQEAKNDEDKKPRELFTETHEQLVKDGEKWAKETAGSFTLVGTLITTIMYAAAFTVPGGNNQETGVPIFFKENLFTTFVVADAISLFTSAASVLIFIGILTSRYAERDFLRTLPSKLLFGLFFLFVSVVSMIVAFCAALGILLKNYWAYKLFIIVGATSASITVIVLVRSQVTLMCGIFLSTISNPVRVGKKYWKKC